jgi:hypothetical protein
MAVTLGACNPLSLGPTPQGGSASSARHPTPLPSGSAQGEQGGAAVWVLSPVGINVRARADKSADRIATLTQGEKLLVQSTRGPGSSRWLQVRTESGATKGWVLDDPTLLIHREVKRATDPAYSLLYPAGWTPQAGNPATFTAPAGDPDRGVLVVQYADDVAQLPKVPLHPGQESGADEPKDPVLVYGVTTFPAVYKLSGEGGWEYLVEKKIGAKVFLFDFTHPQRKQPDIGLFEQVLASVTVTV